MADRRRPLKTVTGVSGAVSIYDAAIDPSTSTVASAIEVAKTAEANKIDGLFAADLLSFGAQGAIGAQEPLIFLAALSAVTTHVGLIATVTTTFHHPFNLARLFGTLDHVSNGRAAWNAVTSSLGEENYSDLDLPSPEERYARAAESLEVVNALFDSWKTGALIQGEGSAVLDPSRVVPIEHRGKYFTVQGPLNIPSCRSVARSNSRQVSLLEVSNWALASRRSYSPLSQPSRTRSPTRRRSAPGRQSWGAETNYR
ncbi:hypothetical protein GCM10020255_103740 [Rhodococcus baikonurensis]